MGNRVSVRRYEFLDSDRFRRNAWIIIDEMLDLSRDAPEDTVLVDEVLHSIFFLGTINNPPYTPEQMLADRTAEIEKLYPKPFRRYSSQLPRRGPFSCVLDMIVRLTGHENEEGIKATLRRLVSYMSEGARSRHKSLISSVVCISQAGQGSVRHYGVSMSTPSKDARDIMVAVSCLREWDEYVAGAVMTHFLERITEIDGTIRLPENVTCQAYSLWDGRFKPPCKSCATLFSLETRSTQGWPYGNCAEHESLSNLFKNEAEVKDRVALQNPESWTAEKKVVARQAVRTNLTSLLNKVHFNWDMNVYTPQKVKRQGTSKCNLQ